MAKAEYTMPDFPANNQDADADNTVKTDEERKEADEKVPDVAESERTRQYRQQADDDFLLDANDEEEDSDDESQGADSMTTDTESNQSVADVEDLTELFPLLKLDSTFSGDLDTLTEDLIKTIDSLRALICKRHSRERAYMKKVIERLTEFISDALYTGSKLSDRRMGQLLKIQGEVKEIVEEEVRRLASKEEAGATARSPQAGDVPSEDTSAKDKKQSPGDSKAPASSAEAVKDTQARLPPHKPARSPLKYKDSGLQSRTKDPATAPASQREPAQRPGDVLKMGDPVSVRVAACTTKMAADDAVAGRCGYTKVRVVQIERQLWKMGAAEDKEPATGKDD